MKQRALAKVTLFHPDYRPPWALPLPILKDIKMPEMLLMLSFGIYGPGNKMRFLDSSYFMNLSTDKCCEQHFSSIIYSKSCEGEIVLRDLKEKY